MYEVKVPDIGDFANVDIVEILVKPGDRVTADDSLITLESDKASMEIPASMEGTIKEVKVKVGDKVSMGDLIAVADPAVAAADRSEKAGAPSTARPATAKEEGELWCDVAVLGSGPGGYTAAFRAADLGKKVVLIERFPVIGGVCLNVGCIPSKALLHMAHIVCEAEEMSLHGVRFGKPKLDADKIRAFKNKAIGKLTGGLKTLAGQRRVTVATGYGTFEDPHTIVVAASTGERRRVRFGHAIIAAGSRVAKMPIFPWQDERVMDSTAALEVKDIPARLLVVGAGIIAFEMATVYESFGSEVVLIARGERIFSGEADSDVLRPLLKRMTRRITVSYQTQVKKVEQHRGGLTVTLTTPEGERSERFDKILVATGRLPNGQLIDAHKAGVQVSDKGYIATDDQLRTNVAHIFAVGDVVGAPMLAHKATHEAKVAAEVIAGHRVRFDAMAIPSVAYTNPEVAWMGKTEKQLKEEGIEYTRGAFPWAASGRSLSLNYSDGLTKALFDKPNGRLLGAAIVGPNAGELIAETVIALEMGATAEDIGLSIHPHPTLSETICFAAEMVTGTITDLPAPRAGQ